MLKLLLFIIYCMSIIITYIFITIIGFIWNFKFESFSTLINTIQETYQDYWGK